MEDDIILVLTVLAIVLLVAFVIYAVIWAFFTVLAFFNVPFWIGIAFLILWIAFGCAHYYLFGFLSLGMFVAMIVMLLSGF